MGRKKEIRFIEKYFAKAQDDWEDATEELYFYIERVTTEEDKEFHRDFMDAWLLRQIYSAMRDRTVTDAWVQEMRKAIKDE